MQGINVEVFQLEVELSSTFISYHHVMTTRSSMCPKPLGLSALDPYRPSCHSLLFFLATGKISLTAALGWKEVRLCLKSTYRHFSGTQEPHYIRALSSRCSSAQWAPLSSLSRDQRSLMVTTEVRVHPSSLMPFPTPSLMP